MTIIYQWEKQGLHIRYVDATPANTLISSAQELSSDSRFDGLKYIIGDWTESTPANIQAADIERLTHYIIPLTKINPHIINPSILPPNDEHRQALVSFYVHLTEDIPWKTDWFFTLTEARSWIDDKIEH